MRVRSRVCRPGDHMDVLRWVLATPLLLLGGIFFLGNAYILFRLVVLARTGSPSPLPIIGALAMIAAAFIAPVGIGMRRAMLVMALLDPWHLCMFVEPMAVRRAMRRRERDGEKRDVHAR